MIAIDTNVIVRFLTNDDSEQVQRIRKRLKDQPLLVRSTVILETEWVLRSVYDYTPKQIGDAFNRLLQTKGFEFEEFENVRQATAAIEKGLDFSDALHIAGCPTSLFFTFDASLKRRAPLAFAHPEVITP
ncbi:MAG: type II toxin-antitoxin system VapC family toxin [Bosea sp. (in: a-proteobacteria)]